MRPTSILVMLSVTLTAHAKKAPSDMKEFNKTCPAPAECSKLNDSMELCEKKNVKACTEFLSSFEKLIPTYDCQRPFDSTPTEKYIVPAIWLCDNHEKALRFLSMLQSRAAKKLFASAALRNTLDGDLAEEFLDKSLKAEKSFKKKKTH